MKEDKKSSVIKREGGREGEGGHHMTTTYRRKGTEARKAWLEANSERRRTATRMF